MTKKQAALLFSAVYRPNRGSWVRNALAPSCFLISLLFVGSCKEPPPWVKEGPLFAGPEAPPPGKALVYIYWPAESPGTANRVWVTPIHQFSEEIRRGGYTAVAVPPGTTSFFASVFWDLTIGVGGSVTQEYGGVKASLQPNQLLYLRIEQGTRFGLGWFDFREVEPDVAGLEIRKCRRMEPVTRFKLKERNAAEGAGAPGHSSLLTELIPSDPPAT